MTPRLAVKQPKTPDALREALSTVDGLDDMLWSGNTVKESTDQPTIHTTYAVGVPPDMGDGHPANGQECLIIAIPKNQLYNDLRRKPRRFDDATGKWLAPSVGLTISATLAKGDTPVKFCFTALNGKRMLLPLKQGLTINIGLVGTPEILDDTPVIPATR